MSNLPDILIEDARRYHSRCVGGSALCSPLLQAFGCWMLPQFSKFDLASLAKDAAAARGGARSYRDVAVIGFTVSSGVGSSGLRDVFLDGLKWLVGRSHYVDGVATGLLVDGVAFLGIAVGINTCKDDGLAPVAKQWAHSTSDEALKAADLDEYQHTMFVAGDILLGNRRTSELNGCSPDACVALQSTGVLPIDDGLHSAGLNIARRTDDVGDANWVSVLRLAALNWLERQSSVSVLSPSIKDVHKILSGVSHSFYRWVWEDAPRTSRTGAQPRKWHIENEYHFQSTLWVVLRPLFGDLKEEEYLKSVGQLQPRADLCIPSLKVIVEVKFWYSRDKAAKLIEEIAADSALYLQKDSEFQSIIPIIWDDNRRTQEHAMIKEGLKKIRGLEEAVIVTKPSFMP